MHPIPNLTIAVSVEIVKLSKSIFSFEVVQLAVPVTKDLELSFEQTILIEIDNPSFDKTLLVRIHFQFLDCNPTGRII